MLNPHSVQHRATHNIGPMDIGITKLYVPVKDGKAHLKLAQATEEQVWLQPAIPRYAKDVGWTIQTYTLDPVIDITEEPYLVDGDDIAERGVKLLATCEYDGQRYVRSFVVSEDEIRSAKFDAVSWAKARIRHSMIEEIRADQRKTNG